MARRYIEDEIHPQLVTGYNDAAARGITPRVLPEPPKLIPGLTAVQRLWIVALAIGISAVLLVALVQLLDKLISLSTWYRPTIGLPGVLWFLAMIYGLHRVGDHAYREFKAGYTTIKGIFFYVGNGHKYYSKGGMRAGVLKPSDMRGLWHLDSKGEVLAQPDFTITPPGFYPSPHRPGRLELWTGLVWAGEYRDMSWQG